ncbi:DNA polymerase-3 subunit delta' [Dethiosulfatibacter aminovorans DSM 17477]|uniref:DNA polymerase III subunit delta' n=1 Tax=Dethiosulfatibacter aminovorans DSM 17477 TaxID=1121476 RepID=A0A1M6CF55_9FIRM|nr:DNA polymerase III subunit delta' [Dethiosulfatibacter aminovorans]SHI59616.1 DNA polymerase-3 subunit delta' [Dethiosulfatibacter aminovorans DSM 17477]
MDGLGYDEVIGQDKIKKHLMDITKSDSISHGYIFEGPKGTGKLRLAEVFAQTILCTERNDYPCGVCSSCIKAMAGSHPDIHVMDYSENSIKRQDVDEIQEIVYVKPYESRRKVIIINDAQKMTVQASNTFLKTLEEPPEDTVIILITLNQSLIIQTIVSRCQTIKLDRISDREVKRILMEEYGVESQMAGLITGYSKGIVQRAVNILREEVNILQLRGEIVDMVDDILKSGKSIVFEYEKYFDKHKDDIDDILEILMIWFRDLSFYKVGAVDQIINIDRMSLIEKQSGKTDGKRCSEMYELFQNTYDDVKSNVNYKLAIDNMLFGIQEVKHD